MHGSEYGVTGYEFYKPPIMSIIDIGAHDIVVPTFFRKAKSLKLRKKLCDSKCLALNCSLTIEPRCLKSSKESSNLIKMRGTLSKLLQDGIIVKRNKLRDHMHDFFHFSIGRLGSFQYEKIVRHDCVMF